MRRPLDSVTVARVGNTQKKSLHPLIVILFTLVLLCTPVQTIVTPEQVEGMFLLRVFSALMTSPNGQRLYADCANVVYILPIR